MGALRRQRGLGQGGGTQVERGMVRSLGEQWLGVEKGVGLTTGGWPSTCVCTGVFVCIHSHMHFHTSSCSRTHLNLHTQPLHSTYSSHPHE